MTPFDKFSAGLSSILNLQNEKPSIFCKNQEFFLEKLMLFLCSKALFNLLRKKSLQIKKRSKKQMETPDACPLSFISSFVFLIKSYNILKSSHRIMWLDVHTVYGCARVCTLSMCKCISRMWDVCTLQTAHMRANTHAHTHKMMSRLWVICGRRKFTQPYI